MTAPQSHDTVDVDGRRLAWRSVGDGPPLMLVNGYAATSTDWDPTFLDALGQTFTVICPDNRGVGESTYGNPDEELTIDSMAQDVERVLDALDIAEAPIAGWSMGGFIAQTLARRIPMRVSAMALLSTDPGAHHSVLAPAATWARLTDHTGTPREQATRLLGLLFPPPVAAAFDAAAGDIVAAARAALDPAVLSAQEDAMVQWQNAPAAPVDVDTRVLILVGTDDIVIPPANAPRLATQWPNSRIEQFEGGGHAFMAQEPQHVAETLVDFFHA